MRQINFHLQLSVGNGKQSNRRSKWGCCWNRPFICQDDIGRFETIAWSLFEWLALVPQSWRHNVSLPKIRKLISKFASHLYINGLSFCSVSYVVVDQLKLMLSIHNPATPCYMTGNNRNISEIIGDAYVLSRESIRRLVRQFRRRNPDGGQADCDNWRHSPTALKSVPTSSRCLDRLGIVSLSTQDERGCERFLSQGLAKELILNDNEANVNGSKTRRCISDRVVIFPRLGGHDFYFYEHLLYRLKMPANVLK